MNKLQEHKPWQILTTTDADEWVLSIRDNANMCHTTGRHYYKC